MEKRLCFHCFGPDHSAKDCKEKPNCDKCGKKHATLLHDRQFKPKQNNGDSLTFRQFGRLIPPNEEAIAAAASAAAAAAAAAPTTAPVNNASAAIPAAGRDGSQNA